MKAIIMAAGKGTRISCKIGAMPKSTLPLSNGTPIIRSRVQMMIECGMEPIICTGYKKEYIEKALEGLKVKYYYNPFYSVTNNMASLWFTLSELDDEDIMLTSADIYYPKNFLERLIAAEGDICMIVDSSRIESGDFYFDVEDGIIVEHGPRVPLEKRKFEYMGLTKISSRLLPEVRSLVQEYIETENYNKYFEDMIISMNEKKRYPITFIDVAGAFWREFDFYEDYQAIMEYEMQMRLEN